MQVIVAVPAATPVTTPLEFTVAIALLELVQARVAPDVKKEFVFVNVAVLVLQMTLVPVSIPAVLPCVTLNELFT